MLDKLPLELLWLVVQYVSPRQQAKLLRVCKMLWRSLSVSQHKQKSIAYRRLKWTMNDVDAIRRQPELSIYVEEIERIEDFSQDSTRARSATRASPLPPMELLPRMHHLTHLTFALSFRAISDEILLKEMQRLPLEVVQLTIRPPSMYEIFYGLAQPDEAPSSSGQHVPWLQKLLHHPTIRTLHLDRTLDRVPGTSSTMDVPSIRDLILHPKKLTTLILTQCSLLFRLRVDTVVYLRHEPVRNVICPEIRAKRIMILEDDDQQEASLVLDTAEVEALYCSWKRLCGLQFPATGLPTLGIYDVPRTKKADSRLATMLKRLKVRKLYLLGAHDKYWKCFDHTQEQTSLPAFVSRLGLEPWDPFVEPYFHGYKGWLKHVSLGYVRPWMPRLTVNIKDHVAQGGTEILTPTWHPK